MWQKENIYGYKICNMGHMTFICDLDLLIMKVNVHTKNEGTASGHARIIMLTNGQIPLKPLPASLSQ